MKIKFSISNKIITPLFNNNCQVSSHRTAGILTHNINILKSKHSRSIGCKKDTKSLGMICSLWIVVFNLWAVIFFFFFLFCTLKNVQIFLEYSTRQYTNYNISKYIKTILMFYTYTKRWLFYKDTEEKAQDKCSSN